VVNSRQCVWDYKNNAQLTGATDKVDQFKAFAISILDCDAGARFDYNFLKVAAEYQYFGLKN